MTVRNRVEPSDGFCRQRKMSSQTPKAAGNNAATGYGSADQHTYPPFHRNSTDAGSEAASIEPAGSARYRSFESKEKVENHCIHRTKHSHPHHDDVDDDVVATRMPSAEETIPEQLVELLISMIPGGEGEDLGEAFTCAGLYPPITKQSLSELDIQNIINNIKLRHDVNFDRDLSFRPNLDGAKGQEKVRAANRYWTALVAELELYSRLFQGSPSMWNYQHNWTIFVQQAQRRIPLMFTTIQEVLKSLVPDRDQTRVDEHLDVPMLMQEIEKGVCDLVRLSEWLAHLLKEHCAPMRDEWVDKMVESTRTGVYDNSCESIVRGLRQLLGILEAMKLDVANHQIRNLRVLLIEDTVNFERNYHIPRIMQGRGRINVDSAQQWYANELQRQGKSCPSSQKDALRYQLEVFVRAVVSVLFSNDTRCDFPETFYLDQDRLRVLKSKLQDLVFFDMCFDMFGQLLRGLRHQLPVSHAVKDNLLRSLSAIVGAGSGHGISHWLINCEQIAWELVRHALQTTGCQNSYDLDLVQETTTHLHGMFLTSSSEHAAALEETILPHIIASVHQYTNSSPTDLFNALVAYTPTHPPPPPPPPPHPSSHTPITSQHVTDTLPIHQDQFADLTNRITHIILLHWRIWGPIVYVLPEEDTASSEVPSLPPPPPPVRTSASTATVTVTTTEVDIDVDAEPPDPSRIAGPAPDLPYFE